MKRKQRKITGKIVDVYPANSHINKMKPGKCPLCGKYTKDWYHHSGNGHATGDFSNDLFCCKKCWEG